MDQHPDTQCRCEFCSIEEDPIFAADGLLFHCSVKGESYIPTEVVEFSELIKSLQKRISAIGAHRRSSISVSVLHLCSACKSLSIDLSLNDVNCRAASNASWY